MIRLNFGSIVLYLFRVDLFQFVLCFRVSPIILGHSLYSKVKSLLIFQWKVWDSYQEIFTSFTRQYSNSKLCIPCNGQQIIPLLKIFSLLAVAFFLVLGVPSRVWSVVWRVVQLRILGASSTVPFCQPSLCNCQLLWQFWILLWHLKQNNMTSCLKLSYAVKQELTIVLRAKDIQF